MSFCGPARLFYTIVRLVTSWWRADRIRVSSRPARLLRLAPGSALRVHGVPAIVVLRQIGETPSGRYIAYECDAVGGIVRLVVRHTDDRVHPLVTWTVAGRAVELPAEEVETFPRPSTRA
ncbi:MAG TPA: hypothetical protein VMS76_05870 [Planctomycetota bacterium]|nr:hypothetical protein [Planctomycetota bacterium]